jgi:hypothetical protein
MGIAAALIRHRVSVAGRVAASRECVGMSACAARSAVGCERNCDSRSAPSARVGKVSAVAQWSSMGVGALARCGARVCVVRALRSGRTPMVVTGHLVGGQCHPSRAAGRPDRVGITAQGAHTDQRATLCNLRPCATDKRSGVRVRRGDINSAHREQRQHRCGHTRRGHCTSSVHSCSGLCRCCQLHQPRASYGRSTAN